MRIFTLLIALFITSCSSSRVRTFVARDNYNLIRESKVFILPTIEQESDSNYGQYQEKVYSAFQKQGLEKANNIIEADYIASIKYGEGDIKYFLSSDYKSNSRSLASQSLTMHMNAVAAQNAMVNSQALLLNSNVPVLILPTTTALDAKYYKKYFILKVIQNPKLTSHEPRIVLNIEVEGSDKRLSLDPAFDCMLKSAFQNFPGLGRQSFQESHSPSECRI